MVEAGYTIKEACNILGIARSIYYSYKKNKKNNLKKRKYTGFWIINKNKRYRRVTAWLKCRESVIVNTRFTV